MRFHSGFTTIELLVVIALAAVLATVSFVSIFGYRNENHLKDEGSKVQAVLQNARQNSISQLNGAQWGVDFANTTSSQTYQQFSGAATLASGTAGAAYALEYNLLFGDPATSSVQDIAFNPLTGALPNDEAVTIVPSSANGMAENIIVDTLGQITTRFETGLVGYYPMDEDIGSSTYDASGYGGSSPATSTTWQSACKVGSCLNFNGTNGYVGTALSNANNTWTVTGWVKASQFTSGNDTHIGAPVVDSDYPSHYGTGFGIKSDGSKLLCIYNNGWCNFTYAFSTGVWYNIAIVYDRGAGAVSAYVNGSLVGSSTVSFAQETTFNKFTIGKDPANNYYWNGNIDDVRIYNRALSAQEIQDLYNAY